MPLRYTEAKSRRLAYLKTEHPAGAWNDIDICITRWKVHLNHQPLYYLQIVRQRCMPSISFFLGCCGCDTSYIVSVSILCRAFIYALSLCRGRSWRVRLAKREALAPPGHLVSPLFCRGPGCPPWCSIVGATVALRRFFCILHIWSDFAKDKTESRDCCWCVQ